MSGGFRTLENNDKLLIEAIIESKCLPKNDINFGKYLQSIDNINISNQILPKISKFMF